jgi:inhibitor of cysteine peptidase
MSYCSSNEAELNSTNGTVKYISLEGGFYGIITDKNEHLDPINLSKEFQVDGKRVTFRYIIRTDLASFHMWGAIIEIIEIKEMK